MNKLRNDLQAEVDTARKEHSKATEALQEAKRNLEKAERTAEAAKTRYEKLQKATGEILSVTPDEKPAPHHRPAHAPAVKSEKP